MIQFFIHQVPPSTSPTPMASFCCWWMVTRWSSSVLNPCMVMIEPRLPLPDGGVSVVTRKEKKEV